MLASRALHGIACLGFSQTWWNAKLLLQRQNLDVWLFFVDGMLQKHPDVTVGFHAAALAQIESILHWLANGAGALGVL